MFRIEHVSKQYKGKNGPIDALKEASLDIQDREFIVVRGPSGSGKSTLLLMLGGMLRPSSGHVWYQNQNLYSLSKKELAQFRAQHVGFVFQMFHLVPYLNVLENVVLSTQQTITANLRREAIGLLEDLGLSHRIDHLPSQLSAGEKQRTAIARALINRPKIILADEPTGNLDPDNSLEVLNHLVTYHQRGGTVLMVTHGEEAEPFADRLLYLRNGELEETGSKEYLTM